MWQCVNVAMCQLVNLAMSRCGNLGCSSSVLRCVIPTVGVISSHLLMTFLMEHG